MNRRLRINIRDGPAIFDFCNRAPGAWHLRFITRSGSLIFSSLPRPASTTVAAARMIAFSAQSGLCLGPFLRPLAAWHVPPGQENMPTARRQRPKIPRPSTPRSPLASPARFLRTIACSFCLFGQQPNLQLAPHIQRTTFSLPSTSASPPSKKAVCFGSSSLFDILGLTTSIISKSLFIISKRQIRHP